MIIVSSPGFVATILQLILTLKTFEAMAFKTICVKSANRLCSKPRKGFGLNFEKRSAYASVSMQPGSIFFLA